MLVVAEKYQTGFDQPLLHTMYVDKKLSGVKAVQTLSRLNRIHHGKEDTFVLDFVNEAEDIQKSFQPYYEATILEKETDPDIIYELKNQLDDYKLYHSNEVDDFAKIYFSSNEELNNMGKLTNYLQPAIERYSDRTVDEQEQFKADLQSFNRLYAFIIQVDRMFDKEMHRFYTYSKMLQKILPKGPIEIIDLDDKLLLEYYKIEKSFEGDIALEKTEGMVGAIKGGSGGKEKKKNPLSVIIERFNLRFGTEWSEADKVLMQIESRLLQSEDLRGLGKRPDKKTFDDIYRREANNVIAEQYFENTEIFSFLMRNPEAKEMIIAEMKDKIYSSITKKEH
jgi:type I restriction enzyme R subunit